MMLILAKIRSLVCSRGQWGIHMTDPLLKTNHLKDVFLSTKVKVESKVHNILFEEEEKNMHTHHLVL